MHPDAYKTISQPSEGFFKDRGSKFHAYAYPMTEEDQLSGWLDQLKKLHPKARHACFAYRLGTDSTRFRSNDDGEPSGTAGKPILGQIDSFEVTDLLIVVIRYFGGTKLGASGLIQAYREAAADALSQATIIEQITKKRVHISFDYAIMSQVMNAAKKLQLDIIYQQFEENGELLVAIPVTEVADTIISFRAMVADRTENEIRQTDPEIEGLTIELD